MKDTPDVHQVIKAMLIKGYIVFDDPAGHDLNIVGIRSAERRANAFDDLLVVFHRRCEQWSYNVFPCTTDPGTYWLEHFITLPMPGRGTAILKEGQYLGAYMIGKHRGKYEALVQRRSVTVIRDPNLDNLLDMDGRQESGMFGINIHHAAHDGESVQVDRWSAGCQVLASWHDFQVFMALCRAGVHSFGNSLSYTLLHERDLGVIP